MAIVARVLLTNDDGFDSPGIGALHEALRADFEVVVAAPRTQQSGVSHAFTFTTPLYYDTLDSGGKTGYVIDGTPSDCVKFAISHLLPYRPDIVVSGINMGENSGMSGFYSGTVAAAREGAFWGVLSVAFSLEDGGTEHLASYAENARVMLHRIAGLHCGFAHGGRIYYNVNFPACAPGCCRGVKVTRQSLAFFEDRYRRVPGKAQRDGYVIYGEKKDLEAADTFDSRALRNNFITITPLDYDATAESALARLTELEPSLQSIRSMPNA
jgi:5'-nucleotidase